MDQGGALQYVPSRRMTLDRNIQHTSICRDSQGAVRNCKRIQRTSKVVSLVLVAIKAWAIMVLDATGGTSMFASRLNRLLKPALLGWTIGLSTIASWLSKKVRREFDFKYTEDYRDKDLETIPKIWLD